MVPLCGGYVIAPPCFHSNLGQMDKQQLISLRLHNIEAKFGIPDLIFGYISSSAGRHWKYLPIQQLQVLSEHYRALSISSITIFKGVIFIRGNVA